MHWLLRSKGQILTLRVGFLCRGDGSGCGATSVCMSIWLLIFYLLGIFIKWQQVEQVQSKLTFVRRWSVCRYDWAFYQFLIFLLCSNTLHQRCLCSVRSTFRWMHTTTIESTDPYCVYWCLSACLLVSNSSANSRRLHYSVSSFPSPVSTLAFLLPILVVAHGQDVFLWLLHFASAAKAISVCNT